MAGEGLYSYDQYFPSPELISQPNPSVEPPFKWDKRGLSFGGSCYDLNSNSSTGEGKYCGFQKFPSYI